MVVQRFRLPVMGNDFFSNEIMEKRGLIGDKYSEGNFAVIVVEYSESIIVVTVEFSFSDSLFFIGPRFILFVLHLATSRDKNGVNIVFFIFAF